MKQNSSAAGGAPGVTIVIPHWKGVDILRHTLTYVYKNTAYENYSVLVVNNGCPDRSIDEVLPGFPEAGVIDAGENRGFAAGCNLGIEASESPYVVLLNNDTEVAPQWLSELVSAMEQDKAIAAAQPRLLWFFNRNRFDYSGAAGGRLDVLGYPFAYGRVFDSIEQDSGQYMEPRDIFWASGAAVIMRRSALRRAGLLDEAFFAHMEEIDLQWRFHLLGYRVVYCPGAVVFHQSGATLNQESIHKMVLNHRNNIIMLLKNYSTVSLIMLLPARLFLEGLTIAASLAALQPRRALAVVRSMRDIAARLPGIVRQRKSVQGMRTKDDRDIFCAMYRGSIVLDYFIRRRRNV